ncbi:hypothetical protein L0Y69_00665 [bacterium]|nr:hypothetical protein [bacterium]
MNIITVEKGPTENTLSVLRRFTKKVRAGGFLNQVRDNKYRSRPDSPLRKKKRLLKTLERTREYERLKKLGKLKVEKK